MDKVQWDKLTKDDITIRFIRGWESEKDNISGGFIIG